ncbi:hypothetical protein PCL_05422 [Purpureocillium lilacinum]|uniref:Uncharacterized protein n=1 Tax=Purpureocillium lilacinum TaxID=33203 RepID=A0A2U3DVF0_PURLI|nr:hypothetical protein PCL_05422 [Purpureocillium lilacinum]
MRLVLRAFHVKPADPSRDSETGTGASPNPAAACCLEPPSSIPRPDTTTASRATIHPSIRQRLQRCHRRDAPAAAGHARRRPQLALTLQRALARGPPARRSPTAQLSGGPSLKASMDPVLAPTPPLTPRPEGGNKMLSRARRMPSPSLFNPPAGQLHVRCDSKDVLRHGLPVAPCIHTLKAARPTRRTASALDNVIQRGHETKSLNPVRSRLRLRWRQRPPLVRPGSKPGLADDTLSRRRRFDFNQLRLCLLLPRLSLLLVTTHPLWLPCSSCCSARARFGYRKLNVGVSAQTVRGPEPFAHSAALRLPPHPLSQFRLGSTLGPGLSSRRTPRSIPPCVP